MSVYMNRIARKGKEEAGREFAVQMAELLAQLIPGVERVEFMKVWLLDPKDEDPPARPDWVSPQRFEPYRARLKQFTSDMQLLEMGFAVQKSGIFGAELVREHEHMAEAIIDSDEIESYWVSARSRAMELVAGGQYPIDSFKCLAALGFFRRLVRNIEPSPFKAAIHDLFTFAYRPQDKRKGFPHGAVRLMPYGWKGKGTYFMFVC